MQKVVGVNFLDGKRVYYFSPCEIQLRVNDYVVVETERGLQIAKVVSEVEEMEDKKLFLPLKNVIKKASKQDLIMNEQNNKQAGKALEYARKQAEANGLDMKFFEASYTLDKKKLTFKFIADERVDFRELAKSLAAKYKTRIELRQIGVRDKAKEIGGLGPCGMPLCCTTFLSDFDSVSINMAKNQGIALNPTKINGSCGRLLCCLGYEDDTYTEFKKKLPKIGQEVEYNGKKGRVIELNVIDSSYKISIDDEEVTVKL